ncbi:WXG100 family type VII secretion target [Streptomyces sp. P1-3]|uniref:WXG100 family type VII secretion target n=1 Tax=Streptomyces sp. P1-3 TaxID=3421658 RepID=UPI003D364EC6
MSDFQKISDPAFIKFKNALTESSTALSSNLKALANVIATTQAAWTGEGANAFTKAQQALNEDHDALLRLVNGIREAVELTQKSSRANDSEIYSQFGKIDVNGAAAGGGLSTSTIGYGTDGNPNNNLGAGISTGSKIDNYGFN